MAITKVINDLIDLNQSGSTSGLKGCAGTTAQQPTSSFDIDYLIVGGGGAANTATSGGGGAGGLLTGTTSVASGSSVVLTVGEGGAIANSGYSQDSYSGNDSGFAGLRAVGGGAAPRKNSYGSSTEWSLPGGSGSGASIGTGDSAASQGDGGLGVSGQGNNGGANAAVGNLSAAGGGGGAGAVGTAGSSGTGGGGGIGSELSSFITYTDANSAGVGEVSGTNVYFAGGGGAGGYSGGTYTQTAGTGGLGGGGNGNNTSGDGEDGAANTGGGAGGGDGTSAVGNGGSGGSGVVILKYDNTVVNSVTVDGTLAAPSTATLTTSNCNYPVTGTLLYQFENNLNDTCGSYNATVGSGSATYIAGKYGNAINFNGSSYLTLSSTLPWSSSFTISLWINPTTLPGGTFHLPFMQSGYSGATGVSFYLFGSAIRPYMSVSGAAYELFNTGSLSTGVWQNIALVRTYNTSWELYLNGTSLGIYTSAGLTADFSTSTSQYFGANPGGLYYYNGGMDQVRIFPSALSASEITELNNEVVATTKFTNGTTDTIVFKEGSGNITFNKADAEPGAEIGMLRCNTTLGQMEHYTATGYKDFTNL